MVTAVIRDFRIELFKEDIYSPGSADNVNEYDFVYLGEDNNYTTAVGIKVYAADCLFRTAIIGSIGGRTGVHHTSHIWEPDRVIICCSDTIFCLSIPDLYLVWKTRADLATCFQIFKLGEDYIVHGELEISRLRYDGQIIWQQSGRDMFTRLNAIKDDFVIIENYIIATDWDNTKYKFDFDGNIMP